MGTNQQESMNETKFSVSMCVYRNDNPEHFRQAIDSVINQTIRPDEIVLVVDGPVPASINCIIQLYEADDYFKVVRLPENVGHGNARRAGLQNCKYELIALMDADDVSLPDRFAKQIKCFADDSSLSVVGGNIREFIDMTGAVVGIRNVPQSDAEVKVCLKRKCPFNQVTVMFKKSEVDAAGGYVGWSNEEDYYLWIRMYKNNAKFKNLHDVLVEVRVGIGMYARRGGWAYFASEAKIQNYMLENRIINLLDYITNLSVRFVVQVLLPNRLRALVYATFFRTKEFGNK